MTSFAPTSISSSFTNYLFKDCLNYSIILSSASTTISDYAFAYCSSLKSITIPETVLSIGEYAFYKCSSLEGVAVPSSVTSVGKSAFYGCSSAKEITLPNDIEVINTHTFYDCSSLESIQIPANTTIIENYAFAKCYALETIEIPNQVSSIGYFAFSDCSELTNITLGIRVESIGQCAFKNCSRLTSIVIPNNVTSIGTNLFNGCAALEEVTVPFLGLKATTKSYSSDTLFGTFFGTVVDNNATAFTSVKQSSSVYQIPKSLTKVTIIGNMLFYRSFQNCEMLSEIIIGDGVTEIHQEVFSGCSNLNNITFIDTTSNWLKDNENIGPMSATDTNANATLLCSNANSIFTKESN